MAGNTPRAMPNNGKVFLSHSSADTAWCNRLVDHLESAHVDVWYDKKGIYIGAEWIQVIERALTECAIYMIVLTPDAWQSRWVKGELALALAQEKQIIGIMHKQTDVSGFITNYQLVNAVGKDATVVGRMIVEQLNAATQQQLKPPNANLAITASMPRERFPARLEQLGYLGNKVSGIEVITPPLCDVSAGRFAMGSDLSEDRTFSSMSAAPMHMVEVAAFSIAQFPVTVAEYACFVREGGRMPRREKTVLGILVGMEWAPQLERPTHPVVSVSWNDAVAYVAWLRRVTGKPWRLLTEAEWERAARWDSVKKRSLTYPWGHSFDLSACNCSESHIGTTTPVGSYPNGSSPCGAQDMSGNVAEWTSSLYAKYPYNAQDGREDQAVPGERVTRGPDFSSSNARVALRWKYKPTIVDLSLGFRLALS